MEIEPNASTEVTDETLMVSLQKGDEAGLAVLMARWEMPVKVFLLRLGVPSSAVEDVAQEAFVRVYQQRAKYRPECAFKPWFLTIAGNLGRNALRWRRRHPGESIDATEELGGMLPDAGAVSPAEAAERSAEATQVRAAVAGLPGPLREAVICVELQDLSYIEASQVLGCSPKAVETRLYRARQTLREVLSGLLGQ